MKKRPINQKNGRLEFIYIPIGRILPNPAGARKSYSDLIRLSESITRYGMLQPLIVRPIDEPENKKGRKKKESVVYELMAGERRLRAARIAGISEVPCLVVQANDREGAEITAVENSGRSQLDYFEEATLMASLIDVYGLSPEEAAGVFGIPKSTVSLKLRLLKLTPHEALLISGAGLSERHARAFLKICDSEKRAEVLHRTLEYKLSVRQTEELIDSILYPNDQGSKKPRLAIKDPRLIYNTIEKAVESIEKAGIEVEKERRELEDSVELIFRIKKSTPKIPQIFPSFSPAEKEITKA